MRDKGPANEIWARAKAAIPAAGKGKRHPQRLTRPPNKPFIIPNCKARHMVHNDLLGPDPAPFGFINTKWKVVMSCGLSAVRAIIGIVSLGGKALLCSGVASC